MKNKVHIKVKGKNPIDTGYYDTNLGHIQYNGFGWRDSQMNKVFPEYHFEEIELPSEEEMQSEIYHESMEHEHAYDFQQGAKHMQNFILNHLKSNTNG